MKKLLAATSLALVLGLAGNAMAQQPASVRGGFQGPGLTVMTVSEALKLNDDAPVKLSGKIEKSLGNEKYLFKDATGSITIEIDDEDWNGVTVGPDDIVEIRGEVDTHWNKPTDIEVDSIAISLKK